MSIEFRVLGPLEAWSGGTRLDLGGPRQQRFTAALAVHAGSLVPWDRVAALVWDGMPPATARNQLVKCALKLRRQGVGVTTSEAGFELVGDLDAHAFDELVNEARLLRARGQDRHAARTFREALALWRGPALGGVMAEIAGDLDAKRADAWQEWIELVRVRYPNEDPRPDLVSFVEAFPLRERPVELLMRAEHERGEHAAALEVYRRFRMRLWLERGGEPSAELRQLRDTVQAARNGAPEQLPVDLPHFVGRDTHLTSITTGLTVISGVAGVGKSALAVHWAHTANFPDGRLYLGSNLGDAVPIFLDALGAKRTGADPAALLRSALQGKRVLMVLDNATRAAQVEPLLPVPEGCAVVVTSRTALEVPGARHIGLDVLDDHESHELLEQLLGAHRVAAEPEATRQLAEACGHLPLTLRVVAGNLAVTPDDRIADAVARLRTPPADTTTEVAFTLSYKALPAIPRRLLRYLAVAPGTDFGEDAAAALLGRSAGKPLAALHAAHLVTPHGPGRYRMHDLVRRYAAERSATEDRQSGRDAALTRWLDHHIAAADAAGRVLMPAFLRLPRPARAEAPEFPDEASASAWFATEARNLQAGLELAHERGFDDRCVHLADALRTHFWLRQNTTDWVRAAALGLASAEHTGWPHLRAAMHCGLALAMFTQGAHDQAIEHNLSALELFESLDDWSGTITVLNNLANTYDMIGELATAAELHQRSFTIGVVNGCTDSQILGLVGLAMAEVRSGLADAGAETAQRCLRLAAGDPHHRSFALERMGWAQLERGALGQAEEYFRAALDEHGTGRRPYHELYSLLGLGHVSVRAGDPVHAEGCFRLAHTLAEELGARHAVADALGGLAEARRNPHEARALAEQAALALGAHANRPEQLGVLALLAEVELALGDAATAAGFADEAVALAERFGGKHAGRALRTRGRVCLAGEDHDDARTWVERAIHLHRHGGQRLHEAEDLMVLAEIARRSGAAEAAASHQARATQIHHELGVPLRPPSLRSTQ
ncbi:SARP family transcriptional regulator [Lentzea sp. NBRC 105346]|uniref:AfsR/SARP family transcriptional regulator n=1 Tax=Lentzea sp. NBRC 105346 TaxID=3032205 RepID=UPI0024A24260|nr:tetratricopeptide repeat protein [Lentzea sp. NBRC 105346]GLZ33217.1 SARP family transcriptional regulator [Lentzea sp. NBRC 105346]